MVATEANVEKDLANKKKITVTKHIDGTDAFADENAVIDSNSTTNEM